MNKRINPYRRIFPKIVFLLNMNTTIYRLSDSIRSEFLNQTKMRVNFSLLLVKKRFNPYRGIFQKIVHFLNGLFEFRSFRLIKIFRSILLIIFNIVFHYKSAVGKIRWIPLWILLSHKHKTEWKCHHTHKFFVPKNRTHFLFFGVLPREGGASTI